LIGPQISAEEELAYLEGDKLWCYFVVSSRLVRELGPIQVEVKVEIDAAIT